jgi:hypothetical protein
MTLHCCHCHILHLLLLSQRSRISLCTNITSLQSPRRPPITTIPMQQLCILLNWHQCHKLQSSQVSIAFSKVLECRSHILFLIGAGTSCILYNITSSSRVQYAIVVICFQCPSTLYFWIDVASSLWIRRIERTAVKR